MNVRADFYWPVFKVVSSSPMYTQSHSLINVTCKREQKSSCKVGDLLSVRWNAIVKHFK